MAIDTNDFKFLNDTHRIENKNEINFYHNQVVKALKKMISNQSCVNTIGLFGSWGSGKSLILSELIKQINKKEENIEIIELDVWKHERDSIRRQLLLLIAKSISQEYFEDLSTKFYKTVTQQEGDKFRYSWRSASKAAIIMGINFIVLLVLLSIQSSNLTVLSSLSASLIVSIFSVLIIDKFIPDQIKEILQITPIMSTLDKLSYSEQFEQEYIKAIKTLGKKNVIIVIDNIDRVETDKIREILSTLKIFLEITYSDDKELPRLTFIIPGDIKEIRKAYPEETSDEYIRKVFNVVIWSPEFIQEDLEEYTAKLINLTGSAKNYIGNDDVKLVINAAFKSNPREIKQFINNLIAALVIASETEVADIIFGNIPYFTKTLVIKQKFPEAFDRLKTNWLYPEKISLNNTEETGETAKEFRSFMRQTSRITVSDAEPYIYFKKPEILTELIRGKEIDILLKSNNVKELELILKEFKTSDFDHYFKYVSLITKRYSSQVDILTNIFNCNLEVITNLNINTKPQHQEEMFRLIDTSLWDRYEKIDLQKLHDIYIKKASIDRYKNSLVNRYISILKTPNRSEKDKEIKRQVITIFSSNPQSLDANNKAEFLDVLASEYAKDPKILSLFLDEDKQKFFINDNVLINIISQIDSVSLTSYLPILTKLKASLVNLNLFNELISKLVSLENQILNPESNTLNTALVSSFEKLIVAFNDEIRDMDDSISRSLINQLIASFQATPDPKDKKEIATTIFPIIYKLNLDEELKNNFRIMMVDFFRSTEINLLTSLMLDIGNIFEIGLFPDIWDEIKERVRVDDQFLDLIYKNLQQEHNRFKVIEELINNKADAGLSFLGVTPEVPNRAKVVSLLYEKSITLEVGQREGIYSYLPHILSKEDSEVLDKSRIEIENLLTQGDSISQKTGSLFFENLNKLFTDSQKREIVKKLIAHLEKSTTMLESIDFTYLELINKQIQILVNENRRKYEFIIFELIRPENSIQVINNAIKTLIAITPDFTENKKNFEDLAERLRTWPDDDRRNNVIEQIKQLEDSKPNKAEQEYWSNFGKYSSQS